MLNSTLNCTTDAGELQATEQPDEIAEAIADLNAMLAAKGTLRRLSYAPRGEWAVRYRQDFGWDIRQAHRVFDDGSCTCGRGECNTPGKHPIDLWRWTPRLSLNEVHRQWYHEWRPAQYAGWPDDEPWQNFALLLGKRSGVVVADVDRKPDKYPLTVTERVHVLRDHGWRLDTCMERTGGGGLHVYASIPKGVTIPSRGTYIEPGIELKAEGQLVIVAPSIYGPIAKKRLYRWLPGQDPFTMPPAPLWPELVDLLADHTAPSKHGATRDTTHVMQPPLSEAELRRRSPRAAEWVGVATERAHRHADGGRHNSLIWLVTRLALLGLSEQQRLPYLLDYRARVEGGWAE